MKKQKRGYWLPTDASGTLDSKWINNIVIKDFLQDYKFQILVS